MSLYSTAITVFSTTIIQSMMGRHGLGGAYGHIKTFEFSLIPTSKESAFLRLVGPTCLVYAGENTELELARKA